MQNIEDIQALLVRVAQSWDNLSNHLFARFGVERYFVVRATQKVTYPQSESIHEHFIQRVSNLLRDSKDIRICLGEMGHRFMDDPKIVDALLAAHDLGCRIRVIHGPRVDPKTSVAFELAQAGIIEMYQMSDYFPHHFVIMESRAQSGKISLADENPHNEALWSKLPNGKWYAEYRSRYRVWYVREKSRGYAKYLVNIFDDRLNKSLQTSSKPDSQHHYKSIARHIVRTWLRNVRERFFVQPVGLLLDGDMRGSLVQVVSPVVFPAMFVIVSLINSPHPKITNGFQSQGAPDRVVREALTATSDDSLASVPLPEAVSNTMKENKITSVPYLKGSYKVVSEEEIPDTDGTQWVVHTRFDLNDVESQRRDFESLLNNISDPRERAIVKKIMDQVTGVAPVAPIPELKAWYIQARKSD